MRLTGGDFYPYRLVMYLRRSAETIAANVAQLIASNDAPKESVAQAADMSAAALDSRLIDGEFTFEQLVAVGGFLHVHPSTFYKGVNA